MLIGRDERRFINWFVTRQLCAATWSSSDLKATSSSVLTRFSQRFNEKPNAHCWDPLCFVVWGCFVGYLITEKYISECLGLFVGTTMSSCLSVLHFHSSKCSPKFAIIPSLILSHPYPSQQNRRFFLFSYLAIHACFWVNKIYFTTFYFLNIKFN